MRGVRAFRCVLLVAILAVAQFAAADPAPTPPSSLTGTAISSSQVNLRWTDNSSNETGFKVERATSSAGPWTQIGTTGANVTTYASAGLSASTTYYYRVLAYRHKFDSAYSNTAGATTLSATSTIPNAPSSLLASPASSSQINLSWVDNSTNETGFKVERATSSAGPWAQIGTTGTNVTTDASTGLSASTAYYYRVRATNTAGDSAYSNTAGALTLSATSTIPNAPSSLLASPASSSQINLSWVDNSTNETGFKVERATSSAGPWTQIGTTGTNVTSYASTGLSASTTYYYRVRATSTAGDSAYSNAAGATTLSATSGDTTPPSVPTGFRAWAATCTQVGLGWTASTDTGGSGLKGYKIYRNGVFYMQVATAGTMLDTVPDPSQTYSYAVSAIDNAGNESARTATVKASPSSLVSYRPQVTYATGAGPYSVASADLDGDGVADLVVANYTGNSVSVLLGRGDGTFRPQVAYATGAGPFSVAIGDLNRDGVPDLAVANYAGGTVSVLLGRGDGTFQPQVSYAAGGSAAAVAMGDLNRDGALDLVVANAKSAGVSVLLGQGNGTFQLPTGYATGASPMSLAIGDLNGDGVPDVVVANYGGNTVSVLLGYGGGTLHPQVGYATGSSPRSVAIGDLDGDGVPDLAVANFAGATVSVLLGQGGGTFQAQTTTSVWGSPSSLAIGQFNRDGKADLVVTSQSSNVLAILAGDGTGLFTNSGSNPATGLVPTSVAVADLNRDGGPDLVVANYSSNTVGVILNSCQ
jgi:hypothetical protein